LYTSVPFTSSSCVTSSWVACETSQIASWGHRGLQQLDDLVRALDISDEMQRGQDEDGDRLDHGMTD
jgi:hypothetical protein